MKALWILIIFMTSWAHAGGVTSGTTPERVFLKCHFANGNLEARTSFASRVVVTLNLENQKPQRFGFPKSQVQKPVFEFELNETALVVRNNIKRNSRDEWGEVVAAFVSEEQQPISCLMRDL